MSFLTPTLRLTRDAMVAHILAIPKTGFKPNPSTGVVWNPRGVVWHNTGVPSTALWESWPDHVKEAWGDNLDAYYKNQERWHSGPHFIGTPEVWSIVACDLLADGVHDSCRNENYYGVETVANAEVGGDDPKTGACLAAFTAAANIIAALCIRFEWDPHGAIDFHRNCKRDGHACPGSLVTDAWAIGLVVARIAEIKGAGAAAPATEALATESPAPAPSAPAAAADPANAAPALELPVWPPAGNMFFARAARAFNKWVALGVTERAAYGLIAQAEAETAFLVTAVGDKGTAFGLHQWHWTPRGAAILAATGVDVRAEPLIERHVAAAYWELTHTFAASFARILEAASARQAGELACALWEGAGAPNAMARRGAMAERWLVYFAQHPEILKDNPSQG